MCSSRKRGIPQALELQMGNILMPEEQVTGAFRNFRGNANSRSTSDEEGNVSKNLHVDVEVSVESVVEDLVLRR
eukprot:CAMPEP_0197847766 /NCGR_PEP_ID=MMETSP1438-20131217/7007_1 /TAXON_ID=1461541 /ORGANISM="Pterosperma sp., Strain CCMP1384" /LENGTH=73 /DNA_ID=CAMNT_0043459779 /DNA_START=454 /DNA_END=675 /DNA_ORIENTATION=+